MTGPGPHLDDLSLDAIIEKLFLQNPGVHDQAVPVDLLPLFDIGFKQRDRGKLEGL